MSIALSALAHVLAMDNPTPPSMPYDVQHVELPEHWQKFEEELAKYKEEFVRVHTRMLQVVGELVDHMGDIRRAKAAINNLHPDLGDRLVKVVDKYAEENQVEKLREEAGLLTGTSRAMEKVLMNTNARRFIQFTCFACTEKLCNVCLDPCGHIMCADCWDQIESENCPVCRVRCQKIIRMFPI
jgi:hypothetical protein